MIGRRDFNLLLGFNKLTTLTIGRNVLKCLSECDTMLEYLPRLITLKVIGPLNYTTGNADLAGDGSNNVVTSTSYTNLKYLLLGDYTPQRDEDLVFITTKFTRLDSFTMKTTDGMAWPITAISSSTMESFFRYMLSIPKYDITIGSQEGEIWLWNAYCDSQQEDKCKIDTISIKFTNATFSSNSSAGFQLKFVKDCDVSLLGATYDGSKIKITARISKLRNYLSQTGENFSSITINIKDIRDQIEGYFGVLLNEKHTNLQNILFIGGLFHKYTTQETSTVARNVNILKFGNTSLDEKALSKLLKDFPKFQTLKFQSCTFKNTNGSSTKNVTISMEDTIIDELVISKHQIDASVLLISVVSYEDDISKYYVSYASDESTVDEVNESKFVTLKKALKDDEIASISVHVKSVSHITINTDATGLTHKANCHKIDISL